ncbi:MAG: hypothetical protein KF716_14875 [Anaerolineae bacterium]|nr:hypothetical protein [Anaerolineae bacterium]
MNPTIKPKQTFSEFLSQRLTTKERSQIVFLTFGLIAILALAFMVKAEFGALIAIVVGLVLLVTYFYIRGLWLKSLNR